MLMTPLEQIAKLEKQIQRQRHANAVLDVKNNNQAAQIARMKADLIEQRFVMQSARVANANRDRAGVESILKTALTHREKTREQRKGRAA